MKFQFSIRSLLILTTVVAVYCYLAAQCEKEGLIEGLVLHPLLLSVATATFILLVNNGKQAMALSTIISGTLIFTFHESYRSFMGGHLFSGLWIALFFFVHLLALMSLVATFWREGQGIRGSLPYALVFCSGGALYLYFTLIGAWSTIFIIFHFF